MWVPGPPLPCEMFRHCSAADSALPPPPSSLPQLPCTPRLRQHLKPQFWAHCQSLPPQRPLPTVLGFCSTLCLRGELRSPPEAVCVCVCLPGACLCSKRWGANRPLSKIREAPNPHWQSTPLTLITEGISVASCCKGHGWVRAGDVGARRLGAFQGRAAPATGAGDTERAIALWLGAGGDREQAPREPERQGSRTSGLGEGAKCLCRRWRPGCAWP